MKNASLPTPNLKEAVLADPRLTTLSGQTATIRAGDTLGVLTTSGGGAGTYTTTQIQSFQTGVTLDITPLVTPEGEITVALHPVVSNLTGILNGIPQISTRDAQTTVHLKDDETLVIGGLIQDSEQRTLNKIPFLGELPLIGRFFQSNSVNSTKNELIIVVTPHVFKNGTPSAKQGWGLPEIPMRRELPALPAGFGLTNPTGAFPARATMPAAPATPLPVVSATPSISPSPSASASPSSSAFTYGDPSASLFAGPQDAPRITYASFDPTTLANGQSAHVSAASTLNVTNITLHYGSNAVSLGQFGLGHWEARFPFVASGLAAGSEQVFTLTAQRADGISTSIAISATVAR